MGPIFILSPVEASRREAARVANLQGASGWQDIFSLHPLLSSPASRPSFTVYGARVCLAGFFFFLPQSKNPRRQYFGRFPNDQFEWKRPSEIIAHSPAGRLWESLGHLWWPLRPGTRWKSPFLGGMADDERINPLGTPFPTENKNPFRPPSFLSPKVSTNQQDRTKESTTVPFVQDQFFAIRSFRRLN